MTDPAGLALIEALVRRDGRSLLQYTDESYPWTTREAHEVLSRVRALAEEERDAVGRLVRFLTRHHKTPRSYGSYPSTYTTLNFVALEHLLPALHAEQQKAVADLETRIVYLPRDDARALLQEHLEMKRRHLEALAELAKFSQPSVIP